MVNTQYYSNRLFDRAIKKRDSIDRGPTEKDLIIPIWNDKFIFGHSNKLVSKLPKEINLEHDKIYHLGEINSTSIYCADLSDLDHSEIKHHFRDNTLNRIRQLISSLDHDTSSLLAYAQGIINWNKHQKFCSICGFKTLVEQKGHSSKCSNIKCNHLFFPQISPAIIVLIEYNSKNGEAFCLLQKNEKKNMTRCSTLAGFVEIGESLEDAVVREMKEEVNVDIVKSKYVASQPWIFSSALMIGFFAESKTKDFKVDGNEIKDASWFSASQIKKLAEEEKIIISGRDSIARFLIESWVEQQLNY